MTKLKEQLLLETVGSSIEEVLEKLTRKVETTPKLELLFIIELSVLITAKLTAKLALQLLNELFDAEYVDRGIVPPKQKGITNPKEQLIYREVSNTIEEVLEKTLEVLAKSVKVPPELKSLLISELPDVLTAKLTAKLAPKMTLQSLNKLKNEEYRDKKLREIWGR